MSEATTRPAPAIANSPILKRGTAMMATATGRVAVPCTRHPNAPGLAVTMSAFGMFGVTHERSGQRMGGTYERAASALLLLAGWASIGAAFGIDYTATDPIQIAAKLRECASEPVPFVGATSSGADGSRPLTVTEWVQIIRTFPEVDEHPWESPSEHPGERAMALLDTLSHGRTEAV